MFSKILIANRGEIACRVIRTARKLGINTVAVYSDADAAALHVQMADEAVHIGGSSPAESYLNMQSVIDAALRTGAEAIHPGYGFLSENAGFSNLCGQHDIIFIGPNTHAIEIMGSKSAAKQKMETAAVPLLPGYHGESQDDALLKKAAEDMGYPVLLKAVAGGGGKGMRQVSATSDFDEALAAARREAHSGFGNDDMLVEKYLLRPRHVEVQVFCDSLGNSVYLFERDCSVQRRHQKIIEEAPAPGISAELRKNMGEAAVRAAQAVDYIGAGTVEFLLAEDGRFYFMEMNTRLQVEHPVTEMITGLDLVEWQLLVAEGKPLPLKQRDLQISGHAFEARIYAEDPRNSFLPAAGSIACLRQPEESANVRLDTGVVEGDEVGVFYDPMIAKLIVWGEDRTQALRCLANALCDYRITGVTTNIEFLQSLLSNPSFAAAELSTDFIERHTDALFETPQFDIDLAVSLAGVFLMMRNTNSEAEGADVSSPWHARDSWRLNSAAIYRLDISLLDTTATVEIENQRDQTYIVRCGDNQILATADLNGEQLVVTFNGRRLETVVLPDDDGYSMFMAQGRFKFVELVPDLGEDEAHDDGSGFKAPMNGTVVDILVTSGQSVLAGDTILIMEAMKMEHVICAPVDGVVTDVFYGKGDLVNGGSDLVGFEPNQD